MNLMEITKGYEPKQNEQTDQTKNLPDTTDRWKQLVKEQAETLEKVTAERDGLQVKNQKMNEFIQEFQERTHKLKMEKQKLFFENHRLQEEMQKSNVGIQQMTAELSEMRKLNQSLQQSNDDLRNRNGLMTRNEQEQLEKEIKDVRDQNSKLEIQVNQSSVEAVEQAKKKQEEAEKQARQAENQAEREKKRAEQEIYKAKKEGRARTEKMRDTEYFWGMGYITVILFAIIQSGAFQDDLINFFKIPYIWYVRFCDWLVYPTYDNGFNQKIAYTGKEAWINRILAIVAVLFILAIMIVIIVEVIKRYKRMWDEIS